MKVKDIPTAKQLMGDLVAKLQYANLAEISRQTGLTGVFLSNVKRGKTKTMTVDNYCKIMDCVGWE